MAIISPEISFLAKGLDLCNMVPVPSMGYLIEEFYSGLAPEDEKGALP